MLALFTLIHSVSFAEINIGGDVYGGGKEGAVGTGNLNLSAIPAADKDKATKYSADEATAYNTAHAAEITAGTKTAVAEGDEKPVDWEYVALTGNAESGAVKEMMQDKIATTKVEIYAGNVRTIFGGGMNGRVYGMSSVDIKGGVIGAEKWNGTIHGGVFAAGDGANALVFGDSRVTVEGGINYNNVYGGGNQANLIGSSFVKLESGKIYGDVYSGARMADVMGYANTTIGEKTENNDP